MRATKTVGLGLGAVVAGAVASCHIVQAAVLAMFAALGFVPFAPRYRPVLVLAVIGCGALAIYGVVRIGRSRRAHLT
jgi:hypothetical protein